MLSGIKWGAVLMLFLCSASTGATEQSTPTLDTPELINEVPAEIPITIAPEIWLTETNEDQGVTEQISKPEADKVLPPPLPKAEYFTIVFGETFEAKELESCETCTIYDINDMNITYQKIIPEMSPSQQSSICTVEVSDITPIIETIDNFVKEQIENQRADIGNAPENDCRAAAKDTRTIVQKVLEIHKNVKEQEATSYNAQVYHQAVKEYTNLMEQFYQKLQYLQRRAKGDANAKVIELNDSRRKLDKDFKELMNRIDQELSQDAVAELIGIKIQVGDYEYAGNLFKNILQDKCRWPDIIRGGYIPEAIPKFLTFFQKILHPKGHSDRAKAVPALGDIIWQKKDTGSVFILELDSYISTLSKTGHYVKIWEQLSQKLRPAVDGIILIWAKNLAWGHYDATVKIINSHGEMMRVYVERLCKAVWDFAGDPAFGGQKILENNFIDFSRRLFDMHSAVARAEMFRILRINQGKNRPTVHTALRLAAFEYETNRQKSQWWSKDVPKHWQHMIRGLNVCIWQSLKNYQVIKVDNHDKERDRVHATAWTSSSKSRDQVLSFDWLFEPIEYAKTWRIKETKFGNYFYAAGSVKDSLRRNVYVYRDYRPQEEGYWILSEYEGTKWEDNRFLLLNTYVQEYLAMDMHVDKGWFNRELGTREMFTYREKNTLDKTGHYHDFAIVPCS